MRRLDYDRRIEDRALQFYRRVILAAALLSTDPGFAQKLVDPNTVAPEFREAAIKRRAEQVRMVDCNHKADQEKVLPRERAVYVNHCLEAAAEK
jgi:hypothetical protein